MSESIQESLCEFMAAKQYKPMSAEQILKAKFAHQSAQRIQDALKTLVQKRQVVSIGNDRYCLAADAGVFTGRIQFKANGDAYVIPDSQSCVDVPERIAIESFKTDVALNGDHVCVSLTHMPPWLKRKTAPGKEVLYARVVEVLERRRHFTVVYYDAKSKVLSSTDPRFPQSIEITGKAKGLQPKTGELVLVQLDPWQNSKKPLTGKIVKALGRPQLASTKLTAILEQYDLDNDFPKSVLDEVEKIPQEVTPAQIKGRMDLRSLFALTIDPENAKDFDDALTVEEDASGNLRIGIHIADVSAYVRPGSNLDREAKSRGNSTYLVGHVVPMLPFELSNGICSLKEGVDRLTKTVFLTFSKKGKCIDTHFVNSVIRSRKRLTYPQALAFLREKDVKKAARIENKQAHDTGFTGKALSKLNNQTLVKIQKNLQQLWSIASKLRQERMKRESLDLDMPDVKFLLSPRSYVTDIVQEYYDESHQLVEEFMLAANEAVAHVLRKSGLPMLYRTHEDPSETKLDQLRDNLRDMGLRVGSLKRPGQVKKLLDRVKTHPQSYAFKIQILRSLKQASYEAEPKGHYGLGKRDYTHFTSPIRRYTDLVVHRILDCYLKRRKLPTAPKITPRAYPIAQLERIAHHCTFTEQNSTEAEREMLKIKRLEFFERELKQDKKRVFKALVLEVKKSGLFVELINSLSFGFISLENAGLKPPLRVYPGQYVKSMSSSGQIQPGDAIQVVVSKVNIVKREIDFKRIET